MILEKGNMWDVFGKGIFMITTNPIRRNDGAVVMGRGIALEAKKRYPQLPYDFGRQLENGWAVMDQQFVGLIGFYDETPIYHFMVKDHWREPAKLEIIQNSVRAIIHDEYLKFLEGKRVDLNFPGIGNGKLKREDVLPLLQLLPDNFHVWEYA